MASLSGIEAPLFGDGPLLAAFPLVFVDAALSCVMFTWRSLNESVGGAAIAAMDQLGCLGLFCVIRTMLRLCKLFNERKCSGCRDW